MFRKVRPSGTSTWKGIFFCVKFSRARRVCSTLFGQIVRETLVSGCWSRTSSALICYGLFWKVALGRENVGVWEFRVGVSLKSERKPSSEWSPRKFDLFVWVFAKVGKIHNRSEIKWNCLFFCFNFRKHRPNFFTFLFLPKKLTQTVPTPRQVVDDQLSLLMKFTKFQRRRLNLKNLEAKYIATEQKWHEKTIFRTSSGTFFFFGWGKAKTRGISSNWRGVFNKLPVFPALNFERFHELTSHGTTNKRQLRSHCILFYVYYFDGASPLEQVLTHLTKLVSVQLFYWKFPE